MPDGPGESNISDAHRSNREQYAGVAGNYSTSASHAGGDDLAWFSGRARSVVPTIAVDVACGGGFSTRALRDAGHRVVATDVTPECVVAARDAVDADGVLWAAGAAERLPVRSSSVGIVGCRIAAHHFADPAWFVDEVARVLQPGGMLLLVDTTTPDDRVTAWLDHVERQRDPSHQRVWSADRWRAVCRGARLDVVETAVMRKRHDLEEWLARSGCVGEQAEVVREAFRSAPADIAQLFDVELEPDGAVRSYTDYKLGLLAVHP